MFLHSSHMYKIEIWISSNKDVAGMMVLYEWQVQYNCIYSDGSK